MQNKRTNIDREKEEKELKDSLALFLHSMEHNGDKQGKESDEQRNTRENKDLREVFCEAVIFMIRENYRHLL